MKIPLTTIHGQKLHRISYAKFRLSVHEDPEKYLGMMDLIGSIRISMGSDPRSRS
jgi:hypothetical protein